MKLKNNKKIWRMICKNNIKLIIIILKIIKKAEIEKFKNYKKSNLQ